MSNTPETSSSTPGLAQDPTYEGGHWIRSEGAEEDTTIRPTTASRHLLDHARGITTSYDVARMRGTAMTRSSSITRQTAETNIQLAVVLDGTGTAELSTGVGFFDHMLTLLAKHSLIDLTVKAQGDLHVDPHHTVEDVGICLGKAIAEALGDKAGIRRYGAATVPMDEVLVTAAVDLSGRPFCVWNAEIPREILGTFNAPLAEEFWRAFSANAACNLHVVCHYGRNTHHIVEGIFKATARALRQALELDPRMPGVPSTKGIL